MEEKQDLMIQKFDALISIAKMQLNENSSVSPAETGQSGIGEVETMTNTEENEANYDHVEISEIGFMGDNGFVSQDSVEKNNRAIAIANTKDSVNFAQITKDVVGLVKKSGSDSVQAFDSGHVSKVAFGKNSEASSDTQEILANDKSRKEEVGFMDKNGSSSVQAFDSIGNFDEMINSIAGKFPYQEKNGPKVFDDTLKNSPPLSTKMVSKFESHEIQVRQNF